MTEDGSRQTAVSANFVNFRRICGELDGKKAPLLKSSAAFIALAVDVHLHAVGICLA